MAQKIEAVVIGAGQAGLSVSRALQNASVDHVVLERGQVGDTWRNQRWDSFRANTPNWANGLLDADYDGDDPGGFETGQDLVDRLVRYASNFSLPVRENTSVASITRNGDGFGVETTDGRWDAANVVVASGIQNVPATPLIAAELDSAVAQLHAADYRSPDALPNGGVLIVGSAQTGAQIAEELAESNREVWLCTSKVGRTPRRYRGRDIMEWMVATGMDKHTVADLPDPAMQFARQGLISGTKGGHSLSLQHLGRLGVRLLGRLDGIDGTRLAIAQTLADNIAFADGGLAHIRQMLDGFIQAAEIDAPPAEEDPADAPFPAVADMAAITELDLQQQGIRTVIWATGFRGEFGFLDFDPSIDDRGTPEHNQGASAIEGLYYAGFPWLRTRTSGLINGAAADAQHIASIIAA